MNTKICSTKNFKKGDFVWFCNIEFTPFGRCKNIVKPITVKVRDVQKNQVAFEINKWRINELYFIDSDEIETISNCDIPTSLGLHVAFSREESEAKFNNLIKLGIETIYNNFKYFESRALNMLI